MHAAASAVCFSLAGGLSVGSGAASGTPVVDVLVASLASGSAEAHTFGWVLGAEVAGHCPVSGCWKVGYGCTRPWSMVLISCASTSWSRCARAFRVVRQPQQQLAL